MYGFLIVVHIFVSLVLIVVILLQAGRGGGIAEVFGGGGATQQIFGVRAGTFLTRATTVCAVVFILTSLSLTLVSIARHRSVLEPSRLRRSAPPVPAPSGAPSLPFGAEEAPEAPPQLPTPKAE